MPHFAHAQVVERRHALVWRPRLRSIQGRALWIIEQRDGDVAGEVDVCIPDAVLRRHLDRWSDGRSYLRRARLDGERQLGRGTRDDAERDTRSLAGQRFLAPYVRCMSAYGLIAV